MLLGSHCRYQSGSQSRTETDGILVPVVMWSSVGSRSWHRGWDNPSVKCGGPSPCAGADGSGTLVPLLVPGRVSSRGWFPVLIPVRAQREEQQRKEQERQREREQRRRWERERMEEERLQAAERERRLQERERLIEERR